MSLKNNKIYQLGVDKKINEKQESRQDRHSIEILQKKIQQEIASDPRKAKKAAMIIEQMLNKLKKSA